MYAYKHTEYLYYNWPGPEFTIRFRCRPCFAWVWGILPCAMGDVAENGSVLLHPRQDPTLPSRSLTLKFRGSVFRVASQGLGGSWR
jgi:hypothetical protein